METYRGGDNDALEPRTVAQAAGWLVPGTMRCQCGGCGAYFARVGTFTLHRVGDGEHRRCLSPEEMMAKGWEIRAASDFGISYWVQGGGFDHHANHGQEDEAQH